MTKEEAKRIGSRQGLISVTIGLMIVQAIMMLFNDPSTSFFQRFLWFTTVSYKLNLFIGAIIMLISGHLFGQIAGSQILIKKRDHILTGLLCGLGVLLTTAFFSGWTGFLQEGIDNIGFNDDPFEDYIYKPFFWITIFGLIPTLIVGLWFGWKIKQYRNQEL